jgi:hypothetical protein
MVLEELFLNDVAHGQRPPPLALRIVRITPIIGITPIPPPRVAIETGIKKTAIVVKVSETPAVKAPETPGMKVSETSAVKGPKTTPAVKASPTMTPAVKASPTMTPSAPVSKCSRGNHR